MFFVNIYIGSLLAFLGFINGKETPTNFSDLPYNNIYGEDYGKDWIYFPDGDGIPHPITLDHPLEEIASYTRRSSFSDIEYRLYTRDNTEDYISLDETGEPLNETHIDLLLSNAPLKIITHGWRSSADKSAVIDIKNAYLKHQNVNVIAIDWSTTAGSIFYYWVAAETKTVGDQVASFLKSINERYNISGDQMHLIGHSLGAHIMGIASSSCNFSIARITGLDPARPYFEFPSRENSEKLDSSDAEFVDVIHTCGGVLGVMDPIGKADFFPNNGVPPQPGCNAIQKILEACSHGKSHDYFAESINNPKSFIAHHCENWTDYLENKCYQNVFMGDAVNRNITGKFYLKTI